MNEHPILFSGEMVRAILEGRKVQTRRVIKPQPTYDTACGGHWYWLTGTWKSICVGCSTVEKFASRMLTPSVSLNHPRPRCPYGIPGDHLWVRETWAVPSILDDKPPRAFAKWGVWFKADGAYATIETHGLPFGSGYPDHAQGKWRPSIFMPRWASRITLLVTGVRVERVQSISEDDAKAEGVEPVMYDTGGFEPWGAPCPEVPNYAEGFAALWDSINAKRTIVHEWEDDDGIVHRDKVPGGYSWQSNPWVWAVTFAVLAQ